MAKDNRKGLSKPQIQVDTKLIVTGTYKPDELLWCSCKLEYPKDTVEYGNVVYCEKRGYFLGRLKKELNGKMPDVVHLEVLKSLGTIII